MKRIGTTALFLCVAGIGASLTNAQDTNSPPEIDSLTLQIYRNIGGDAVFGPFNGPLAFDPATEKVHELDIVEVTVVISDPDWLPDPNDPDAEPGDDQVFILFQNWWNPVAGYPSPEPPPIFQDLDAFFPTEGDGFSPIPEETTVEIVYVFQIPTFVGENQAKLRGIIDFDVWWTHWLLVSNEQDPGCTQYGGGEIWFPCDSLVAGTSLDIFAVQNPVLEPPNPPAFADAGPDRTVGSDTDITLDASGSFDGFNIGFDPDSEFVFIKDTLLFTWEWVDGPVRVDPVQTDPSDPTATVNFSVLNDAAHPYYEFKVTISDQVNPAPSTDSVRITVVDPADLVNLPPVAKIVGPDDPITVGSIITLCGRQSCDPDCDPDCGLTGSADDLCSNTAVLSPCDFDNGDLKVRWQQVNELGGLLNAEQTLLAFQPLSGLTDVVTDWQAITPGKFHFRLLVDDGANVATDSITVVVMDTETNAATAANDSANAGGAAGGSQSVGLAPAPALCGAGLMPAALAPLAMCALWRRRR